MRASKLIALLAAAVPFLISECASKEKEFRPIIDEVMPLIEDCRGMTGTPLSIRGKCLVWDVPSNSLSWAYSRLPRELQASPSDSEITIFLVLKARDIMVGTYSISGQPGYRQYMDVCVVYWPETKVVGMHSVVSREPPPSRVVRSVPEYGDPSEPIADWIKTLLCVKDAKPLSHGPLVRETNPNVVMETNFGPIEIELFWKETHNIAENFLRLVISGYYDGLIFHRVVPGFVIQGGDPTGTGSGGPGYTLPDESTTKKHDRGALAMARGQQGNNGSQFYIVLSKERTAHLDAQNFSIFAQVVKGMEVVEKIAQVERDAKDMPKEKVIMTKVYEKTE